MSRPSPVVVWATAETVYPGVPSINSPWIGAAILDGTPVNDYFTPGVAIAAEDLNYKFNLVDTAINNLAAYTAQQDALNWGASSDIHSINSNMLQLDISSTYYNAVAFIYDNYSGVWLAYTSSSSFQYLFVSTDALVWSQVSGTTFNGLTYCAVSNGAGIVLFYTSGGAVYCVNGSGSSGFSTASGSTGNMLYGSYFNSTFCGWGGTSYYYSTAGTSGWSTVVTLSFSVSGQHCNGGSGGKLLLMPSATNPTNYLLSSNGTSFTSTSFGVTFDTGSTIVGASYDASSGLYVVVTSTGTTSKIYTSPSGAASSWTLVASISHVCGQLLCNGSEWLMVVALKPEVSATALNRLLISTNQGVTWNFTKCPALPSGSSFAAATNGELTGVKIVAGGGQFLLWCNTPTGTSGTGNGSYWLSNATGLPPALTY